MHDYDTYYDLMKLECRWSYKTKQKNNSYLLAWCSTVFFYLTSIVSAHGICLHLPKSVWMQFVFIPSHKLYLYLTILISDWSYNPVHTNWSKTFCSFVLTAMFKLPGHSCSSFPSIKYLVRDYDFWVIDPLHKFHNAPVPYPIVHRFVSEMWTWVIFLSQNAALGDSVQCIVRFVRWVYLSSSTTVMNNISITGYQSLI